VRLWVGCLGCGVGGGSDVRGTARGHVEPQQRMGQPGG
jgi:hypothetical protein